MIAFINLAEIDVMGLTELGDRWLHFGAGVLWIGLLWFFNWVNSAFAPTLDAESKKKVLPELLPRALYWFRWGAAFTWITGVILMFMVYYHGKGGYLMQGAAEKTALSWLGPFAFLIVGFLIYDILFKALAKQHSVAVVIWALISMGFFSVMVNSLDLSQRAAYIHVAALFGTAMAANVWMRIWPAQQRIIPAIKAGQAPDPADAAMAGLRSKHNTYMSVPLLLIMVGTGQPMMWSLDWYIMLPAILVIGFLVTKFIYGKAKTVPGM